MFDTFPAFFPHLFLHFLSIAYSIKKGSFTLSVKATYTEYESKFLLGAEQSNPQKKKSPKKVKEHFPPKKRN